KVLYKRYMNNACIQIDTFYPNGSAVPSRVRSYPVYHTGQPHVYTVKEFSGFTFITNHNRCSCSFIADGCLTAVHTVVESNCISGKISAFGYNYDFIRTQ